jgi:hypothetical protein
MPLPPTARAMIGVTTAIGRLPSWLRPAATGAVIVGAMTVVRAVFVLLFQRGAQALQTLGMVLAAVGVGAYAGAVGGFAYSLAKKPAERLGTFRPYALGLACGWAYLLSFGIPLTLFTHEEFFRTTTGWVILAIAATTLGLVVGHAWFRRRPSN